MENFVRDYGTGNAIPEPPMFVNYANTDAPPVSSSRVVMRPSSFVRSSQRTNRPAMLPQDDEPYDDMNHAGVGAGGPSRSTPDAAPAALSRSATQKSTAPPSLANGVNGHVSPSREPQRRQSTASAIIKPAPVGDPVDPTVSNTQLVIGNRAFDVDPSKDPQQQKTTQARTSPPVSEQDPLVKQMTELSTAAATSVARRNTIRRDPPSSAELRKGTGDSLATPSSTPAGAPRDFRKSGEVVVGSYPLSQAPSRATSPNPPKAAFVTPPPPSVPPATSNIPVGQVVSGYQRPFPGEPRSRANSYVGPPVVQTQDPGAPRPTSRAGYPGVGTQSLVARQPSPSPVKASPTAMQPYNRGGPPAVAPSVNAPPNNNGLHRGMSMSHRPVTPTNPVGIALGPDGRVVHDMMVQPVRNAHYTPAPAPPPPPPPQSTQPYGYHESRALTHAQQPVQQAPRNDYVVPANAYGGPYGHGHGHGHGQHGSYSDGYHSPGAYAQVPPPPLQPQHSHSHSQPHAQPPPQPQPQPQPQTQTQAYNYGSVTRGYHHPQSQSVGYVAGAQKYAGNAMYRSASPMRRSPSPVPPRGQVPPPTGAYTDDGRPILFYGVYSTSCFWPRWLITR